MTSLEETDNPDIIKLNINNTIIINISKSTGQIEIVNKLTTFEIRALAQGKTANIPFSRDEKTEYIPRTDLHTHFAGALRAEVLIKIGIKCGIYYPAKMLEKMGVDTRKYKIDDKGDIKVAELEEKDKKTLEENLKISTVTKETYNRLHDLYQFRKPFTKNTKLFPYFLMELANDYKEMGIEYVELSMSDFMTKPEYMQMLEDYLPKIEQETGVKLRFLAAIGRRSNREWNLDEIDRMKTIAKSPYIVGMDVMGQELNISKVFAEELRIISRYVMEEDPEFVIRVHAGENSIFPKNVKDTLQIIYNEHEEMERKTCKKLPMPKVRIGHGLYGVTDDVLALVKEMDAVIELNISSNFALNYIKSISQIPIERYLKYGIKVVLGTDGHGIFSTSSKQEAVLAISAKVTPEYFKKMQETEAKILENSRKREEKHPYITNVQRLYSGITYNTPNGKPRYTKEIKSRCSKKEIAVVNFIRRKLTEIGANCDEQEVENSTKGKIPIIITGASKNNWSNIETNYQYEIAVMMQVLANTLDPEKAFLVTGGTNFGVEKKMHEAVHRRNVGKNNKLILLGTLTMQAINYGFEGLEKDTITHAILLVGHDGKVVRGWQELPYTQLEYGRNKGGSVIAIGGGGIVSDMIQRAHNLGDIDLHIMDGPFGASTDCSRSLEGRGYSFKTITELIKRLYSRNPEIFIKEFSVDKIEKYITQAKKCIGDNKMPGYVIHLAIAKKYIERNNVKDPKAFIKGCIMPDLLDKRTSHYGEATSNPDFQKFLNNNTLESEYNQGYLLHLISDYLFYNKYLNRFMENFSEEIYNDYNKINRFLIEKYKIDVPKEIESIVGFEQGEPKILDKESICNFIDAVSQIDFTQLDALKKFLDNYDLGEM